MIAGRNRNRLRRLGRLSAPAAPLAPAVFDLNGPARYVHWHFFQMSVANLVVIGLMIVVFVLAILLPFPGGEPDG
jgi:hypothetical protein